MARITSLRIEGYRSVGDRAAITFPLGQPVVLVGENNAGKSNLVRALQLVLGPFWPGNHEPEDHEFFGRDRDRPIEIAVEFAAQEPLGGKYTKLVWRYDPGADEPVHFRGVRPDGREGFISNDDRDSCMCVLVEAERNLAYHLSYASKWTLLSRLMRRFHRALEERDEVRTELEQLFEHIKDKFHEVPEFKAFVGDLREQMRELVSTMPHRLEVDFEAYNPVNFFHALRLHAAEEGQPRTLEEMGTGEQQVLALAFAHAYARAFHGGLVLVVEEPEAHLHPLAQQWLAQRLRARCQQGLQLVVTTHSPAFVDIEGLEGLVLVYKEGGQTRVRQLARGELVQKCIELGVPQTKISEENVLSFYAAHATPMLLSGLFARSVVLVEGPSEALALPVYFRKCGLEVEREGVAVLPVGGKGNLAKWYRLYRAYGFRAYVVFDNDPKDDGSGAKRRDALTALGIPAADHDRLIEVADWVVDSSYTIFGQNFERTLREWFPLYGQHEDKARTAGIESKPFIAKWVAERLDRDEAPGWAKIEEMVRAIRNQGGTGE